MSQAYELRAALDRKQNIIQNVDSYYENIQVQHKKRNQIGSGFFKIVLEPTVWYETERRFNEGKFRKDLADTDAVINNLMYNINSTFNYYSGTHQNIVQENIRLDAQVVQKNYELKRHLQDLSEKQSIPTKLHAQQTLNSSLRSVTTSLEAQDNNLSQQEQQQLENITVKIKHSTEKMRAAYLANMYKGAKNNHLMLKVVNNILSEGVDYVELAWIAIKNKDIELFDLSLHYGVNLDLVQIESKTLISHILSSRETELIKHALSSTHFYDCTAMLAIKSGDIAILQELLNYKPELQYQLFGGNSLLQHAVVHNKAAISKYLIELDQNITNIANENGESVFKTALIVNASQEIFSILLPHINLIHEKNHMQDEQDQKLKSKAEALGFFIPEIVESVDHLQSVQQHTETHPESVVLGEHDLHNHY